MELTEAQKLLLEYLMSIGAEKDEILVTMLCLKKPEHTDAMIDYIVENPTDATISNILREAIRISGEDDEVPLNIQ